jgi:hypothetical protein
MTFRSIGIPSAMLVAFLLTSPSARAECERISAKEMAKLVMEGPRYELVFSGTVMAVARTADTGYRATLEVDRVWKGSVTKRFDLYIGELAAEIPRFEIGHHYLALARKLVTAHERKSVGLDQDDVVAFTPVACSDPLSLPPDLARELGPGRVPPALAGSRARLQLHEHKGWRSQAAPTCPDRCVRSGLLRR